MLRKLVRSACVGALLFFSNPVVLPAQAARPFNEFVGFGDSTIDSGWFIYTPHSPLTAAFWATAIANGGGKPTTPYGLMVSEVLAAHYGLTAYPADKPGGGTNYAASGAQDVDALVNPHAPSTVSQIATYLSHHHGIANDRALYLVSSGGNDVKYAGDQFNSSAFTQAQADNYVINAANGLAAAVHDLEAAGARYVIMATVNEFVPGDPLYSPDARRFNNIYDSALYAGLADAGVHFIPGDRTPFSAELGHDPASFGFQSILPADPACIDPDPIDIPNSWALYCTPQLLVAPNAPMTHLWADDEHYAAAGQRFLAGYYIGLVDALLDSCSEHDHEEQGFSPSAHFFDARHAPTTLCDLWRAS
jgi:outer membrane lipase/esterase